MRLTDEKIADVKEYLSRSMKVTASSLIPQLSKYGIDLIDTIEALQQENEQLQAQVARMREALTIANNYIPDIGQSDVEALRKAREAIIAWDRVNWCDCDRCKNMRDALATIGKVMGGKEDV
jgi:hypothetical protein